MPVSPRMREIESEIDQQIKDLDVWNAPQNALISLILKTYRDSIEVVFIQMALAMRFEPNRIANLFAFEHYLHAGFFQILKWAMEFSKPEQQRLGHHDCELVDFIGVRVKRLYQSFLARFRWLNIGPLPSDIKILSLVDLGKKYEALVDILKMANHDQVSINIDNEQRVISVYEGGNLTGEDAQLIAHNAEVLPVYAQSPLIEDGDQLTSRWSAGDFRSLMRTLSELAQDMETDTIVSTSPGQEGDLCKRPVILDIPNSADSRQQAVLDDITLAPSRVEGAGKWKLTTWRDIPCLLIGSRRVGPSNMIKALAGFSGDDYMLRIASRVDPNQYSNVSGLRESRMIAVCKEKLRAFGWEVYPRYMLTNPPREIDIYAKRANSNVVIQLKSTLRPETPWEVLKRNDEILKGISHTAEVLPRFPEGTVGFVITDGYRGDYVTWRQSLIDGVMVGTINDIEEIAGDSLAAINTLKAKAGFTSNGESEPLPDRIIDLFDWTIRLIDEVAP